MTEQKERHGMEQTKDQNQIEYRATQTDRAHKREGGETGTF